MITSRDLTPFSAKSWEFTSRSDYFSDVHRFLLMDPTAIPGVFHEFSTILLKDGVVRLPFNDCLFEYVIASGRRIVLIAKQTTDVVNGTTAVYVIPALRDTDGEWHQIGDHPVEMYFDKGSTWWDCHPADDVLVEQMAAFVQLTAVTTLIISSNSFVSKTVVPPQRLQRARSRVGKPPLYEFRFVEIVPRPEVRSPPIGTHASPALHWRRGHYRRMNDKIISISPCLVGNAENGIVEKAYDARRALG